MRKEVPAAVEQCHKAGIVVRMVTGDNIFTAKHIAHECGIYTDGIAMEGPQFRRLAQSQPNELIKDLPRLQVETTLISKAVVIDLFFSGFGAFESNGQTHACQHVA